ncbi:MAG: class I SAM-dependent methyltransferase [Candidatus Krumholzibacteriia bacterium]
MPDGPLSSSFRDPGGFLFRRDGRLLRQVNASCADDLACLHESGLYDALLDKGLLIPHTEVSLDLAPVPGAAAVLEPECIPFISYPYEWCFTQLRDAAVATLRLQRNALAHGMVLKDASAYNIQFLRGKPVLIDTLSFTRYRPGEPWVAYRQFCQHFLAPLALMSYRDHRMLGLLRSQIDGVPLDLGSGLLPRRSLLNPGILMHVHLHARSQKRHAGKPVKRRQVKVSRDAMIGITENLHKAVKSLRWKDRSTEWADYYDHTNYSDSALAEKRRLVGALLDRAGGPVVWDLGANTGHFSRLAADRGWLTVAMDIDPAAVEMNWLDCRGGNRPNMLPLVMDLKNPSPSLGWAHRERDALLDRGPADTVIALALVHHLAIANNLPLERVADFLASAGRRLIIEFVPKPDSQVQRLLASRDDIFPFYHQEGFESAFARRFTILDRVPIPGTLRSLYLMARI